MSIHRNDKETTYMGDNKLAALLEKDRAIMDLAAVKSLMPAIHAAPSGERESDWIELVAPKASPELRSELMAFQKNQKPIRSKDSTMDRLDALRAEMRRQGLDGFVVPRADEFQGEYVPLYAERLAYITNFTGSAGLAIILLDHASIYVDGRYTIQVRAEVDSSLFDIRHVTNEPPEEWLRLFLKPGFRLSADPKLLTSTQWARFENICKQYEAAFIPAQENPLDAIWRDRPAAPFAPVTIQKDIYAGKSNAEKRQEIAEYLEKEKLDAAILSASDSVNWLLNIRGGDLPRTPFALGYAILHKDQHIDLFMDRRKFSSETLAHLGNNVTLFSPEEFQNHLAQLSRKKILVDQVSGNYWTVQNLRQAGAEIIIGDDPCALPKAKKNPTEIKGAIAAHLRDGAAIVRFLHWFSEEAPKGHLNEISAAEKLASFRRKDDLFRDFSFDTISAAGPNGAICHYRVSKESNRPIELNSLYLVDSGGQYKDGTTDITRTLAVGNPQPEMKDRFTRVLKGHIALACARFPKGTTGHQLDAIARLPLWQLGLNYDHGTGHGVGSYLSVHEGPQRISPAPNRIALEPGMILSNEPGYYKDGEYGIRIENLIVVQQGKDGFLEFETITMAPIDLGLVDKSLLDQAEIQWLNNYHQKVKERLAPLLTGDPAYTWFIHATRPI